MYITMPSQKTKKEYSTKYNAVQMRKKRAEMVKKDPLYLRKCVWVVETVDNQQIAFKDRKDIKIRRISKDEMKENCIKSF